VIVFASNPDSIVTQVVTQFEQDEPDYKVLSAFCSGEFVHIQAVSIYWEDEKNSWNLTEQVQFESETLHMEEMFDYPVSVIPFPFW
jgi:hypothetical protein